MSDSTAILMTPPGGAAIAVVRLTGPLTGDFLRAHFSRAVAPGRCVHGMLGDAGRLIDDPVIVLSPDGQTADVNLHGGPWVIRSALDLAAGAGFVVVERPEIPLPLVAIDARTAIEREMLSYLPLATTELALSELLRQPEAWARFENLPPADRQIEAARIVEDRGLWRLLRPPCVAIVGVPNVGKSTLANQLFGQERSITADLPGTTRDWVGEIANLDGLPVLLLDTPGIRATSDPIESAAIEGAVEQVRHADLILLMLDASRPVDAEQAILMDQFPDALKLVNKCDLPAAWNWRAIDATELIATAGTGLDALRNRIQTHFGVDLNRDSARWWTEPQRKRLATGIVQVK